MKLTNISTKKVALIGATVVMSAMVSLSAQAALVSGLTVVRVGCGAETNACTLVLNQAIGPAACTSTNITWNGTTAAGKNAYAALLTAKASDSTVRINFDDNTCNGNNPALKSALLE